MNCGCLGEGLSDRDGDPEIIQRKKYLFTATEKKSKIVASYMWCQEIQTKLKQSSDSQSGLMMSQDSIADSTLMLVVYRLTNLYPCANMQTSDEEILILNYNSIADSALMLWSYRLCLTCEYIYLVCVGTKSLRSAMIWTLDHDNFMDI